jgi:hypothetical protein
MNYFKIYHSICINRKNYPYSGYTESHHIVPKSLGGSDHKDNLVDLSAREHFICHLLLTKMYSKDTPNYYKMIKAFMMMLTCKSQNQNRFVTSKSYSKLREEFSKAQSLSQSGKNNSQYGKKRSPETAEKIKQSLIKSFEHRGDSRKRIKREISKKQKEEKRKKDIDLFVKYYNLYDKVGFVKFVSITGYDKSQVNLVQRFKKLVPNFIPQNGKKRG